MVGGAAADPAAIEQKAKTNYAVINSGNKAVSDIHIQQSGSINAIASSQTADQNGIATAQNGQWNTVVIYQEGWIDSSSVLQQGPKGGNGNLPTSYHHEITDDGYLSYFASGGFSLVTLSDPGHTLTSHFGRYR